MKKLNISEEAYNKLKKKFIIEVKDDDEFFNKNDMFGDISSKFMDFYDALVHPEYLNKYNGEKYNIEAKKYQSNKDILNIKNHADAIFDILEQQGV